MPEDTTEENPFGGCIGIVALFALGWLLWPAIGGMLMGLGPAGIFLLLFAASMFLADAVVGDG